MKQKLIESKFGHRNALIYKMRKEQGFSLRKVGWTFGLSREQVRQICNKIDTFLKSPKNNFLITGEWFKGIYIEELGLSKRSVNALKKNGVYTIEQLKRKSYDDIMNMEGIGWKCAQEIFCKVLEVINYEER